MSGQSLVAEGVRLCRSLPLIQGFSLPHHMSEKCPGISRPSLPVMLKTR